MVVTTPAIVISALKYNDTSLIVKCFTKTDGFKSYLLRGVLTSKKGKLKAAYFQPLTILELVASHKNKGTLERISEAKVLHFYKELHVDIAKNSVAFFIAEIVANVIQQEEADAQLYQFLEDSFLFLDVTERAANFYLKFLIELTRFLGFYPDRSSEEEMYFQMEDGCFTNDLEMNSMNTGVTEVFKVLLLASFPQAMQQKMNHDTRKILLDELLRYYKIHLEEFKSPKSLQVLQTIF